MERAFVALLLMIPIAEGLGAYPVGAHQSRIMLKKPENLAGCNVFCDTFGALSVGQLFGTDFGSSNEQCQAKCAEIFRSNREDKELEVKAIIMPEKQDATKLAEAAQSLAPAVCNTMCHNFDAWSVGQLFGADFGSSTEQCLARCAETYPPNGEDDELGAKSMAMPDAGSLAAIASSLKSLALPEKPDSQESCNTNCHKFGSWSVLGPTDFRSDMEQCLAACAEIFHAGDKEIGTKALAMPQKPSSQEGCNTICHKFGSWSVGQLFGTDFGSSTEQCLAKCAEIFHLGEKEIGAKALAMPQKPDSQEGCNTICHKFGSWSVGQLFGTDFGSSTEQCLAKCAEIFHVSDRAMGAKSFVMQEKRDN